MSCDVEALPGLQLTLEPTCPSFTVRKLRLGRSREWSREEAGEDPGFLTISCNLSAFISPTFWMSALCPSSSTFSSRLFCTHVSCVLLLCQPLFHLFILCHFVLNDNPMRYVVLLSHFPVEAEVCPDHTVMEHGARIQLTAVLTPLCAVSVLTWLLIRISPSCPQALYTFCLLEVIGRHLLSQGSFISHHS